MKHFIDDLSSTPVIGLEDEYPAGFVDPLHSHRRSQLLYASSGVMSATTPTASFVIPPQRALWVPAGVAHEVSCRGHVSLRTLYFDDALAGVSGWPCRVIEVSDFLKALIIEMARIGIGQRARTCARTRIAELLIDELRLMPAAPYHAPMPKDRRLRARLQGDHRRPCRSARPRCAGTRGGHEPAHLHPAVPGGDRRRPCGVAPADPAHGGAVDADRRQADHQRRLSTSATKVPAPSPPCFIAPSACRHANTSC